MHRFKGIILSVALLAGGCGTPVRSTAPPERVRWRQVCRYFAGANGPSSADRPARGTVSDAILSDEETDALHRAAARLRAAVVAVHTDRIVSSRASQTAKANENASVTCAGPVGSGVIVDGAGLILTSAHVVRGAESIRVRLNDGTELAATEVTLDPRLDLAFIRVKPDGVLSCADLTNESRAESPQALMHLGIIPGGGDRLATRSGRIVSLDATLEQQLGSHGADYSHLIESSAAIRAGFSGGPAIDCDGRIIGLNVAVRSGGAAGVGRSYLVPITDHIRSRVLQISRP